MGEGDRADGDEGNVSPPPPSRRCAAARAAHGPFVPGFAGLQEQAEKERANPGRSDRRGSDPRCGGGAGGRRCERGDPTGSAGGAARRELGAIRAGGAARSGAAPRGCGGWLRPEGRRPAGESLRFAGTERFVSALRFYVCQSEARDPLDFVDSEGNREGCVLPAVQSVVDPGYVPAHFHVAPGALRYAR